MNINFGARHKGDYNTIMTLKKSTELMNLTAIHIGQDEQGRDVLLTNDPGGKGLKHANEYDRLQDTMDRTQLRYFFANASDRELDNFVRNR